MDCFPMNKQPDIDICSECKEHASFACCETDDFPAHAEDCNGELVSECCGAGSYNTDSDWDMER